MCPENFHKYSKIATVMDRLEQQSRLERSGQASVADDELMLAVTKDTGKFLSVLLTSMGASKVLEVGTSTGYSTSYPGVGASTTIDDIYNGIIDTVVARFPSDNSIKVIDPNAAGWDPTTMIGNTDGFHIHKNDKGERFYCDMYMAVINALQPREGLVKIA